MAITRDEEIYNLRKAAIENNTKQWQDWSVSINYVVDQFNDVVSNLTERLEIAETTIEALMTKINHMDDTYVKLQYNSVIIPSSSRQYYTKSCGVFSNVSTGQTSQYTTNTVYVYSDKSVDGLYLNGATVANKTVYSQSLGKYIFAPFTNFSGSDAGTIVSLKTNNANKVANGNINLYFSLDSTLEELKETTNDNTTVKMGIKINYATVVRKSLETLDKSALSKAIIKNTAMINEKMSIDKYSANIGLFSTTKTVANVAKQKKL